MSSHLRSVTASVLATLLLATQLIGVAPRAGAATVSAVVSGELTPLDLDVVYHYSSTAGSVTYTNLDPAPVTISGLIIGQVFDHRWAVSNSTCQSGPIAPAASCTIELTFFASVSGTFFVDEANLTVLDGSEGGATTTLVARVAPPPTGETWTRASTVRGSGTNPGNGIARTMSSSAEYYHVVFTGETVAGVPVGDDGPFRLVAFTRSSTDGDTWAAPERLNPPNRHGTDPVIAAAGRTVYVAWVGLDQADPDADGDRVLFLRTNRGHGAGTWEPALRLSPRSGRVLGARIAASGANVIVGWTDGDSGDVRVAVSNDRGHSWRTRTLGVTSRGTTGHRDAGVTVAADGGALLTAWISSGTGNVKVRGSLDGGDSWAATRTLGTGADAGIALSAGVHDEGGAVAWVDGAWLRSGWSKGRRITGDRWTRGAMDVAHVPGDYLRFQAVSISLRSDRWFGMAYQLCRVTCHADHPDYRGDVWWQVSPNRSPNLVIAGDTPSASSVGLPSSLWPSGSLRAVLVTAVDPDTGKEHLRLSLGVSGD